MTTSGTIDYERLAQSAMRGVIREILKETEQSGLPGEHHFYVQFETHAPGVNISKRLRQRYPDEMTIVLQHRFWDLAVHDDYFEVKLTFDSIPERLVVPFSAIKVFFDPSVRYALQFENLDMASAMERDQDENGGGEDAPFSGPRSLAPVEPNPVARLDRSTATSVPTLVALSSSDNADDRSDEALPANLAGDVDLDAVGTQSDADQLDEFLTLQKHDSQSRDGADVDSEKAKADDATAPTAEDDGEEEDAEAGSGVVVSLDAFRKK